MESQRIGFTEREVEITSGKIKLQGILGKPDVAKGIVLFAHGSGSGRLSSRNTYVAGMLQTHELATLLMDLLEDHEAQDRAKVFDIALLADRLQATTEWVQRQADISSLPIGYFGASTGAGAALQAAAQFPTNVGAVVSRGGRPDLAKPYLAKVKAPTLLIVGGHDFPVIQMNQEALVLLTCPKELTIVPGATHLFEEPGALEEVGNLACQWFTRHLWSDSDTPY